MTRGNGQRVKLVAWGPWVAAVLVPPAAAAALVPLRGDGPSSNLALAMVVVVCALATTGRRLVGVVAGLSAGAWFDFFLTRPYEQFAIDHRPDLETTILLTVVAVVVGEIAARRRLAWRRGQRAREEVADVLAVSELLSAGAAPEAVIDAAAQRLQHLLAATCHFDASPAPPGEPGITRSGHLDRSLFGWDVHADGLPPRDVGLPVLHHGRYRGRFVLRHTSVGPGLDADQLLAAVALADLAGAALGPPLQRTPSLN